MECSAQSSRWTLPTCRCEVATWDVRDHQVAEVLCAESAQRPTVVTITVGANDFLRGDADIFGIAWRVKEAVNLLLNNGTSFVSSPVLDPISARPCRPLTNVTILVSTASIPATRTRNSGATRCRLAGFRSGAPLPAVG